MSDTLFSPSWYRVANLKPALRRHTNIHRHEYRGKVWFVLQDQLSGRSHRIDPLAYRVVGLMDGDRTVNELWLTVCDQAGDQAPTQDDVIQLLGQLHSVDALICDVTPDSDELFRRYQKNERMRWKQRIGSPLAIRFPLFDPDRFLNRSYPFVSWLLGWSGLILWSLVVGSAFILALVNWDSLTENVVDRALTPGNLALVWLIYPFVKAMHELGHGYAVKKSGGEVHDIGMMLLVLVPVPYVDASAASGFQDKHQRMLVGAAGIMVELFLGAIALFVWLSVEPGVIHTMAYNVMLISGISTLLFNGNPLLRFDGYYVLADFLEIPNLGTRANKYLGFLIQRYGFGGEEIESPADSTGEKVWFTTYGLAAFVYRLFIMFVIIVYVSGKFFAIGVLLAIWAGATMIVVPIIKNTSNVLTNPRLKHVQGRVVGISFLVILVVLGFLFVLPAPYWTRTEGVTLPVEDAHVRSRTNGFVVSLMADAGSQVRKDQILVEMRDSLIETRLKMLHGRRKELESQLLAAQTQNRARVSLVREALGANAAAIQLAQERISDLLIRSPRDGQFIVPQPQDLPGRFLQQGQLIAYVLHPDDLVTVRVVVAQNEIALVRQRLEAIDLLPVGWGESAYRANAQNVRLIPGGTTRLPSTALGIVGGGRIAVDPRDSSGWTTLRRVFELEVDMPNDFSTNYVGRRVHVRIDHGSFPLGLQLYRSLQQLFLRQFGV